ncbi:hypothetical protein T459_18961 [Capsicum annuum]|uniref:Uncharacterized protein n=1 Tax=Capsicum annuum TaxID=4072 RepID=A0A1U8H948_CAPAN|nr:uncharacterized protein LOC107877687 [Capsicum annuum]KAF3664254.1 Uveal autoantigen with coiled-coil domains and ankyrin repeats isoform 2 [Capsicum annuum]PHT75439.1 hypothetical protein T459_18961 [Capsicum annuum]
MVYSYTPTYYSSLHDSITSLCKTILPFPFKKKRIPAIAAAEQRLSKQQSDNLKWQQESFHQILNLMGLCKEGILAESEVSGFRSHLLDTLIASPADYEHSSILRDKLIFLQELFYAKCISEEEYHSSKRPLFQRLAVQGAEIEAKHVIVGSKKEDTTDDEWSVIDLKDEKSNLGKENSISSSKDKQKQTSALKQIKGAASVFGFASSKKERGILNPVSENCSLSERNELGVSTENPFWNTHLREKDGETKSILMVESLPNEPMKVKKQKKPFKGLFGVDDQHRGEPESEGKSKSGGKKQWGFDGFKKWKKNDSEDETAPLSLDEKSDRGTYLGQLVAEPVGEGPDTKQIKRKLHPNGAPSDFFVDKVLGDSIKKELSRIQTELGAKNASVELTDDQIEAISTRLPVDKADLKKFFPKKWCDRYGDVVLDVVRKEFKNHVGEMGGGNLKGNITKEEEKKNSKRWTTFDDDYEDENCHPNLFAPQQDHHHHHHTFHFKQDKKFTPLKPSYVNSSIDKGLKYNPFFDV